MSRNCQYNINSKRGDSKTVPMVTSEVTAEQRLCDAQEFRRWIRTVRRAHDGHSQLDGLGIIYLTQVAAVALNSWISAHSSVARSMRQAAADQPRADSTFRPTSSRTHQPPPSSSTVHSCGRACPLRRGSTRGPRPRSSAGLPARAPAHTADGTGVTRKNCASSVRSRVVDGSCQRDLRACNRNDPPGVPRLDDPDVGGASAIDPASVENSLQRRAPSQRIASRRARPSGSICANPID